MTHEPDGRMQWRSLLLSAVLFTAVGAGGAYLFLRRATPEHGPSPTADASARPTPPAQGGAGPTSGAGPAGMSSAAPLPDVVVSLTEEAVARAGIEVATVVTSATASRVRIPGTVQPNAYRSVAV